jgi:microcystin-dependent protein
MKKIYLMSLTLIMCSTSFFAQYGFLGEIKLFAGNFPPKGWVKCEGQLLPINQNQALFSLLGTTYGGDGRINFALPDYRGRSATGVGPTNIQGQKLGAETTTLSLANIPAHSHNEPIKVSTSKGNINVPSAGNAIAAPSLTANSVTRDMLGYSSATANTALLGEATSTEGTTSPTAINTVQPYLALTYIIAIQGIFPSSN